MDLQKLMPWLVLGGLFLMTQQQKPKSILDEAAETALKAALDQLVKLQGEVANLREQMRSLHKIQ
jgi:hypothetical protein